MKKSLVITSVVILAYFAITVWVTWPIILKMTTFMYAIYGDAVGGIWATWWLKYALWDLHTNPLQTEWLAAPFSSYVPFLTAPVAHTLALIPNILKGEVFAYNFMVMFSFVFAGLGMYLLVNHLTKNKWAAFVAGAIFAFSPYHIVRAQEHWDLAQIQWIPFFVLFLLRFGEKKRWPDLLGLAAFFLLQLGNNAYYVTAFPVIIVIYLAIKMIKTVKEDKRRLRWILPSTIVAIVISGFLYGGVLKPRIKSYNKPIEDFYIYSLLPHDYLLPHIYNPYFGKYTDLVVRQDLAGQGNPTEKTAYLGFIPLTLALFALISRKSRNKEVIFFTVIALFFFALSLKPKLDIWRWEAVPMLGLWWHKIAPFARSINRYSLFVQFSVATLAGIGLTDIFNTLKSKIKTPLLLVPCYLSLIVMVLFLILGVEYRDNRNNHILSVRDIPLGYQWLMKQPDDIIIMEFPTMNTAGYGWSEHAFYQTIHKKKMFNAHMGIWNTTIPPDKQQIWKDWHNSQTIFNPKNIETLKELGVDYILVHPNAPFSDVQNDPNFVAKVDAVENLELVDKFPPAPGQPFCCGWDVFGALAIYKIK